MADMYYLVTGEQLQAGFFDTLGCGLSAPGGSPRSGTVQSPNSASLIGPSATGKQGSTAGST